MLAELISPNLHVILIHYPLAMLIAGTMIELFSFLWRRSSFRIAGRWMILIGALSAIPATFSGIYALRDISRIDVDSDMNWVDLKAASPVLSRPDVWQLLHNHMLYQSIATAIAAFTVVVWLGAPDRIRKSLHALFLLPLLWSVSIVIRAAWFGGESIYKKGVAVEPVFPIATSASNQPSTQPVSWLNTPTKVEQMFPPVEMHPIMAGVFTAIALASIGLSFRKITATLPPSTEQPMVTGDPATVLQPARTPITSMDMGRTFNPNLSLGPGIFVPAGRFWLLAFLLAIATFAGGLFIIARGADLFTQMNGQPKQIPNLLWEQIKPATGEKMNRHFAHAIAGVAIIVLPIILALLARFAPRQKMILSLVTLILIAVITAQVWLGVLLLFDTSQGPINHFNPPAATETKP